MLLVYPRCLAEEPEQKKEEALKKGTTKNLLNIRPFIAVSTNLTSIKSFDKSAIVSLANAIKKPEYAPYLDKIIFIADSL